MKLRFLDPKNLNFVIAICAVLISGASFYATYLQADSAEKQVRAMTLPLIHYEHGNYDQDLKQKAITFTLTNAGVGPAIVHSIKFMYHKQSYRTFPTFFSACCGTEFQVYQSNQGAFDLDEDGGTNGGLVTSALTDVILPGQSEYLFMRLYHGDASSRFWEKLNQERWDLNLEVCYCTLLHDCFKTQGGTVITEVKSCPAD